MNNGENVIEGFINKRSEDFSSIKPVLTNEVQISSKYLATNALKFKFTYLKLVAIDKRDTNLAVSD